MMIDMEQDVQTRRGEISETGPDARGEGGNNRPGAHRDVEADRPEGKRARIDRRRALIWGGGALVVALLAFLVLRPTPIPVELGEVVRGPIETVIETDGATRVVDRFTVTAPVSGRLERITLREGEMIGAGSVIARITQPPLDPSVRSEAEARLVSTEARLREAVARTDQTGAAMEQAARRADRVSTVGAAGGMSQEAVELAHLESRTAEREHAAAVSRVDAARAEAAAARDALTQNGATAVPVRAATGGRLLRIHEQSERVVAAGSPILELGETHRLEVVAEVLSTDAVRIPSGARMRIGGWGGDELNATVRLVEPGAFTKVSALGVEEQRVRVVGDLLHPPAALGDGYRVEARIVTWSADDAVKVPASALFRVGDGWSVFVAANGKAEARSVEIGGRNPREAEVIAGLTPGESVVLYPSEQISEGTRVRDR